VTDEAAVREEANRLAGAVQLEDIIYFETSAKRQEPDGVIASDVPEPAEVPIQVMIGQGTDRLLIRVVIEVTGLQATFRVDVGAQFVLAEAVEPSPDVLVAFASRSAMGILVPFIRESLMTMASRMRVPAPMLPLEQFGHLTPEGVTVTE